MVNQLKQEALLVKAVFSGDADAVKRLLKAGEDVNATDREGRTALHAAAFCGDADICTALLDADARVNAKDSRWLTPLHRACFSKHDETVDVLVNREADVNARDKMYQTPLHVAAARNAVHCAKLLLPRVVNVNVLDRSRHTALHYAVNGGYNEMCRLLLANGASVTVFDNRKRRALHLAAYHGHLEILKMLIESGADVNARDQEGFTAMHAAAAAGHEEIVNYLLSLKPHTHASTEAGGVSETSASDSDSPPQPASGGAVLELEVSTEQGNTALHLATLNGRKPVLEALVAANADVNARNKRRQTPMHFAAVFGTEDCLTVLLNVSALVNVQCNDGRTPLIMAAAYGRHSRCKLLIERGASVDEVDNHGNTALHLAARFGHELIVDTLLAAGADTLKSGPQAMLPLHVACANGHAEVARKLLAAMTSLTDINVMDEAGNTCLHWAAIAGSNEILMELVQRGADVTKVNQNQRSALHLAIICCSGAHQRPSFDDSGAPEGAAANGVSHRRRSSSLGEVDALLTLVGSAPNYAQLVNASDSNGCTALHYLAAFSDASSGVSSKDAALRSGDSPKKLAGNELLRRFVNEFGGSLSARDSNGFLPLHYAATAGKLPNVEVILSLMAPEIVRSLLDNSFATTPLHLAAFNGHVDVLNLLMKHVRNVDVTDMKGRSALHLATSRGHVNCCQALLNRGGTHLLQDSVFRWTPVHIAAANGHVECLRAMISLSKRSESVIDCRDEHRRTPLMLAAQNGKLEAVRVLLGLGAKASADDCYKRTALHRACANGHMEVCQLLLGLGASSPSAFKGVGVGVLSSGGLRLLPPPAPPASSSATHARVDHKDFRGLSALHMAAACGHPRIVLMLLELVSVKAPIDSRGYTPLHLAAYNGHDHCIEVLLKHAAFQQFSGNKFTPLHCAVQNGHDSCIETIVQKFGDKYCNAKDLKGRTPLHVAAFYNRVEAINLLNKEAHDTISVDAEDVLGRSPLMYAAMRGSQEAFEALVLANANQSAVDNAGNTFLHYACTLSDESVAIEMLQNIDISNVEFLNKQNDAGRSALHMSVASGQRAVVKLLMERGASSAITDRQGLVPMLSSASNQRAALCLAELVLDLLRRAHSPNPTPDTSGCLEALERFVRSPPPPALLDSCSQAQAQAPTGLSSTGGYAGELDDSPSATPKRPAPQPPATSSPSGSGDGEPSFDAPGSLSLSLSLSGSSAASGTLQLSRDDASADASADADADSRLVADGCGADQDTDEPEPAPDEDIYSGYIA